MPKSRETRNGGVKASGWEQPIKDEAEINTPFVPAYRLGIVPTAYLTTHPKPVEPPDFQKAAAVNPALRDELHRLVRTFERDDLAALANALSKSVGNRPSGPHRYAIPQEAAQVALRWGIRIGQAAAVEPAGRRARKVRNLMSDAVAEVTPLLPPSVGQDTRAARARELVDSYAAEPPDSGVAAELARAILRARRAPKG
jgi:hypothetical protein